MNMLNDESCPPADQIRKAMETWTCEEINEYYKLRQIRKTINYMTMGIQIFIFLGLILELVR